MLKHLAKLENKKRKTLILAQGSLIEFMGEALIISNNPRMALSSGVGKQIVSLENQIRGNIPDNVGGEGIQSACARWIQRFGEISAEKPAITQTPDLPFQTVIHTVLPVCQEDEILDFALWETIRKALDLADLLGMHSVGIPSIPNWPSNAAAQLMIRGCADYLLTRENDFDSIYLVLEKETDARIYQQVFENFQR